MTRLFCLLGVLALCAASASAQECRTCQGDGVQPYRCTVVEGGQFGSPDCVDDVENEPPLCVEWEADSCYSCGVGPCEWGRAKAKPVMQYARFQAQKPDPVRISLDLAAISRVARANPALGYALATYVAKGMPIRDGTQTRIRWVGVPFDAKDAEHWLNRETPAARLYYTRLKAETNVGTSRAVAVGIELHGNALILISLSEVEVGKARRLVLTLREDQIVRGGQRT